MGLNESDTRAKLIDPAIHARGWTEDLIRREETAGAIEIIDGKPRKQAKGRVNLDETGISIADILARKPVDANTGQPITAEQLKALYDKTEYENRLLLP